MPSIICLRFFFARLVPYRAFGLSVAGTTVPVIQQSTARRGCHTLCPATRARSPVSKYPNAARREVAAPVFYSRRGDAANRRPKIVLCCPDERRPRRRASRPGADCAAHLV